MPEALRERAALSDSLPGEGLVCGYGCYLRLMGVTIASVAGKSRVSKVLAGFWERATIADYEQRRQQKESGGDFPD